LKIVAEQEVWSEPTNGWIALKYMLTKNSEHKPVIRWGVGDTSISVEKSGLFVATQNNIEPIHGAARMWEDVILMTYSSNLYTVYSSGYSLECNDNNSNFVPHLSIDLIGGAYLQLINTIEELPVPLRVLVDGKTGWGL
jgi:hypothetical protein